MADILRRIVEEVQRRMAAAPAPADLETRAREAADRRRREGLRSLAAALSSPGPAVIAECKKASPSAGLLRRDFDPVALAAAYQRGGAAAISVVTEPDFFQGDPAWVRAVRDAVRLPVLRKDFIVTRRQLLESVLLGADAVLLINRILDPDALRDLTDAAHELSLEVLVEVFADEDPAEAAACGARLIGVNARDLATFAVDLEQLVVLGGSIPDDRVRVAESGIHGPGDIARLSAAGYDGFLVGEHLVRAERPAAALGELLGRD